MSIDGCYDDSNVFARILRGEIPCAKVYEDEAVLAFMDLFPQTPGHTLVIPKAASRNLLDTPDETLSELIVGVKKVAAGVRAGLEPDGLTILQYNGAPAGQTVFHIHFHILPRYEGVELGRHAGKKADPAQLAEQAAKIAAAIAG